MSGSTRERILIALLPTILVVLVWFGLMRPTTQFRQKTTAAEKAQSEMISGDTLLFAKSKAEKLKSDLAQLEREKSQSLGAWRALQGKLAISLDKATKLERVSELLREKGLTIVGETSIDTRSIPKVAPLEEARRKLTQPVETQFPDLFEKTQAAQTRDPNAALRDAVRIELTGTYNQIRAALTELRNTEPEIVPTEISMDEPKGGSPRRKWMLTLSL